MRMFKVGMPALMLGAASILSACGGSDSDNTVEKSYLTYYNLSSNAPITTIYSDDSSITSVSYLNTSGRRTLATGSQDIKLCVEEDEIESCLYEQAIDFKANDLNFLVSVGTLAETGGDEPLMFTFSSELPEDNYVKFNLIDLAKICHESDMCADNIDVTFYDAGTANVVDSMQASYGQATTKSIVEGTYDIVVTSGDEELIRTDASSLYSSASAGINVFFAITDRVINNQDNVALVLLSAASSTPFTYSNEKLESYFRVYNSLDSLGTYDLVDNVLDTPVKLVDAKASDTLTDSAAVTPKDYTVDLVSSDLSNTAFTGRKLALTRGADNTIVYYRNDLGKVQTVTFANIERPETSNHYIYFVNLLNDSVLKHYPDEDNETPDSISLFLTKDGNFDAANPSSFELGDVSNALITSGTYTVKVAVVAGVNAGKDEYTVIKQLNSQTFGEGGMTGDYILIAEPVDDSADTAAVGAGVKITLHKM
ncbi:hypothetical protein [Catenovulum maritimum]|uniref:DUF4397 domain-containing protein n=1 Tax=Catenovulum maritimum TaxID=1513271 RepID=A0A0J8GVG4_9ALTE|nr:hypothetical protein [Catenovulum maritimum]KMT64663.1 hypothetical protein XM47_13585 [Catenovulum maritimum]